MTYSFFDSMPDEVILYCLKYLNEQSLARFSLTCCRMSIIAQDNQLWLNHCFLNPQTSALINSLDIQEELTSCSINPYDFFRHVLNKNSVALQALLASESPRQFSLWFASYEQLHSPRLFSKPLPASPHNLFLTQEIGKKKTLNRNKVKDWVMVDVTDDGTMLKQLLEQHQISYTESFTTKAISSYTSG